MNQLSGLPCGLSSCRVAIALAGIFFATLASQCQSEPVTLIPGCPNPDQHAALARHSLIGNTNSEPEETDVAIGAASSVTMDVRGASFSELARIDLRVRTFRSQSDYLRTRFSFSRFLLFMPMQYFVDVNPALFQEQAPSDGVVRFWPTNSYTSFLSVAATAFADSALSGCCQSGRQQSLSVVRISKPFIEVTETASEVIANGFTLTSHQTHFRRSDETISLLRRSGQFRSSYKNALNYLDIGMHTFP